MLDKTKLPKPDPGVVNEEAAHSCPIVCHYDKNTLITKEGALLQILEITGENVHQSNYESILRDEIRRAITSTIKDCKISVYLHTIRERKNVMPAASFTNEFAQTLNQEWCAKNNFDKQLINTVYITIVYQGLSHGILNPLDFVKSLVFPLIKREHRRYLESAHAAICATTKALLENLKSQGARMLGLLEEADGVISEPLTLYYHIANMERCKMALVPADLSHELSSQTLTFHFNSIEVSNKNGSRYAALFSIKDYYEASPEVLDQLLQQGFEYILTQTIIFVPPKVALKEYKALAEVATLAKHEEMNKLTGLKDFIDADRSDVDLPYCKHQTTLTVFSDDPTFFQDKIKRATRALHNLGLLVIREDFNMAALFWAQLPGNIRFTSNGRFTYLDSKHVGAYCTIFDKEAGNYCGSKWGAPISLVRTERGTPFYFNFHNRDGVGHTLIVGPPSSGKTVIARFLIAQALKAQPKVIYLDFEGNSRAFIEGLGGRYFGDEDIRRELKINPFELKSFAKKPELFADWLMDAMMESSKAAEAYRELFKAIAEKTYQNISMPDKKEILTTLFDKVSEGAIREAAAEFFADSGPFVSYLDEKATGLKVFSSDVSVVGIDLSVVVASDKAFKTYIGPLLEELLKLLDGTPHLIYLNKLERMREITYFKQIMPEWLRVLGEKNCVFLSNCEHKEELEHDEDYHALVSMAGTQIFLSDRNADKYFKRCYNLTEDELHKIKSYSASRRICLLKQDGMHKMLSLNLSDLCSKSAILDTGHA